MVAHAGGQGSLIGATIGGYQVEALIGRGAMGAVYLARDVKLNRRVALKVLLGSLARTPDQVKAFLKEAHTAAPLNHPGIVRIYSAGVEEGTPFIAMEFVNGEPLDRFMKRKGTLKWDVALQIGRKLSNALDAAHKAGVVHRDIKPSNIMLDQQGGVRLTDFGIAAAQSDDTVKVQGQGFLGTPQYMSPEQARGQEVTASSDLYSLGVTLYELISGNLPFTGESSMALINSICNDEAPRLNSINPEVPDDVARFVAYLMGKTPKDRPANAKVAYSMCDRLQRQKGELSSVSDSLTGFLQDEMEVRPFQSLHQPAVKEPVKSPAEKKKQREQHRRVVSMAVRAAVVAIVAAASFFAGLSLPGDAAVDTERTVPEAGTFTLRDLGNGAQAYQFSDSEHDFADVQWVGGNLVLRTCGSEDSPTSGAAGIMRLEVANLIAHTLADPTGESLDPNADPVYRTSLERARVVSKDGASTFLIAAQDSSTNDVVLLARDTELQYADPNVILRVAREEWVWGAQNDVLHPDYGHAVMSPSGHTIACVLYDAGRDYSYITLLTRGDEGLWSASDRRTMAGNDIVPVSLQFSRDGSRLFYIRRASSGGGELWMLPVDSAMQNGDRILSSVADAEYALSEDGSMVAVSVMPPGVRNAGIIATVVQVQTKTELFTVPGSRVGRGAFHPDGTWIVINYFDNPQAPVLRAHQVSDPEVTRELTLIANGLTDRYAFSDDGRRLAAVPREASVPSVLVMDWNTVSGTP